MPSPQDLRPVSVAFVGLGAMGLPMAKRCRAGGCRVYAYDTDPARLRLAEEASLTAVPHLGDLPEVSYVIIMVTDGDQLLMLLNSPGFLTRCSAIGSTVVVMSTVGTTALSQTAERAAHSHVSLIDAPVSGGIAGAESGELVVFAAGPPELRDNAASFLDFMGKVVDCGESLGGGQLVKMANQMLVATHLLAAAEALSFAQASGLPTKEVLQALVQGAAQSWILADRGPRMLPPHDQNSNGTPLSTIFKDVDLVSTELAKRNLSMPVFDACAAQLQGAANSGLLPHDDSGIIGLYPASPSSVSDSHRDHTQ